jgi:hypothetical protein
MTPNKQKEPKNQSTVYCAMSMVAPRLFVHIPQNQCCQHHLTRKIYCKNWLFLSYTDRKGMSNSAIYMLWFGFKIILHWNYRNICSWTQITNWVITEFPIPFLSVYSTSLCIEKCIEFIYLYSCTLYWQYFRSTYFFYDVYFHFRKKELTIVGIFDYKNLEKNSLEFLLDIHWL